METLSDNLRLAEYTAIQADIQRRLSDRFYLTFGTLTVSVSLVGISAVPGIALLIFPWAVWLVSLWMLHNEISIKRKNRYIRTLETHYFPPETGFLRWKDALKGDRLLSTDGLDIETIINRMLIGCDTGVLTLGTLRIWNEHPTTIAEWILASLFFVLALVAIGLTMRADFARREKKG